MEAFTLRKFNDLPYIGVTRRSGRVIPMIDNVVNLADQEMISRIFIENRRTIVREINPLGYDIFFLTTMMPSKLITTIDIINQLTTKIAHSLLRVNIYKLAGQVAGNSAAAADHLDILRDFAAPAKQSRI